LTQGVFPIAREMFAPYRTVGLVCTGSQQSLQHQGGESFLSTSIGRGFQVWRMSHLSLSLVSAQLPEALTHVCAHRDTTFTATESCRIVVWRRARPGIELTWGAPGEASPVVSLLHLGEVLLSLHEDGGLLVWDAAGASKEASYAPSSEGGGGISGTGTRHLLARHALPVEMGRPTCMVHPDTYLNKVAVGLDSGSLLIFNFNSGKMIHECRVLPGVALTALAQSPVVDVAAVGAADGTIALYNLRLDAPIFTFSHGSEAAVSAAAAASLSGGHAAAASRSRITSLSFSSGNALALPLLASTTEAGALALWNLETQALAALLPYSHSGEITHAEFLPGQPTLLTVGGGDNSLRQWALDKLDGRPRLLRSRSGHTAPPRRIRYFATPGTASNYGDAAHGGGSSDPAAACELVSAGADRRVRCFHTARDVLNCELSQGKGKSGLGEKDLASAAQQQQQQQHSRDLLSPVISLASSDAKSGRWADLLTVHAGSPRVACWAWGSRRLEDRFLVMPDARESATCVSISACGNFAHVGGSGGTVCAFNVESGARRGVFPNDASVASKAGGKGQKGGRAARGEALGAVDRDTGRGRVTQRPGMAADSMDAALFTAVGLAPVKKALAGDYLAPASRLELEGGGGGKAGVVSVRASVSHPFNTPLPPFFLFLVSLCLLL
jgi:U3 small nucleolar RNA-associated protein 21